jgi:hypothetical protein
MAEKRADTQVLRLPFAWRALIPSIRTINQAEPVDPGSAWLIVLIDLFYRFWSAYFHQT